MNFFLEFLRDNIIFVIVAIGWLVSGVSGVLTRAARQAEKRRREQEARGHAVPRSETSSGSMPDSEWGAEQAPARREARSEEDIAAEIRRMMGLDLDEEPEAEDEDEVVEPVRAPRPAPPVPPRPVRVEIVPDGPRRRHEPAELSDPAPNAAQARRQRMQAKRPKGRLIDLSNAARLVIWSEILGPPRADREFSQDR